MCLSRHEHDKMSDQQDSDELDLSDTYVPYTELTGALDLVETAAQVRRESEAQKDREQNPFGDTTGIKIYPFVRTRVSWTDRVLSWLRRSMQHDDQ
jgi:hypothetical protein